MKRAADIFLEGHSQMCTDWDLMAIVRGIRSVNYLKCAKAGTFFARDNVHNFIEWCRHSMQILECLLFESDDLIMRKNEKHVIFCLMEVARLGAKFGKLFSHGIQIYKVCPIMAVFKGGPIGLEPPLWSTKKFFFRRLA